MVKYVYIAINNPSPAAQIPRRRGGLCQIGPGGANDAGGCGVGGSGGLGVECLGGSGPGETQRKMGDFT